MNFEIIVFNKMSNNIKENSPAIAASSSVTSKRKSRGSNSSSSDSLSESECSDDNCNGSLGPPASPRKRARTGRHDSRYDRRSVSLDTDMDQRFAMLSNQLVSHINNILMANCNYSMPIVPSSIESNNLDVPRTSKDFLRPPPPETSRRGEDITNLSVTVKEPSVTPAIPERVTKLTSMQRFDSSDWNAVRYNDTQKKYVASPGFTELKINEELKRFDDSQSLSSWSKTERTFASLSNAVMAQNEMVNTALQNLIDWSAMPDTQLSPLMIYNKLKELFGDNSGFKSVSHDLLQIICGKRAEVLESRRRYVDGAAVK